MTNNYIEILEQEYHRVKSGGRNILLVRYNNEFSFSSITLPEEMTDGDGPDIFLHEYDYREIQGPVAPFLTIIKSIIDKYGEGDYEGFLERVNVYPIHRNLFLTYWKNGEMHREEPIIRTELEYEKDRMVSGIVSMILEASRLHPFLLLINRLQIANYGTIRILDELARDPRKGTFGMVLSVSESIPFQNYTASRWEEFAEFLDDEGCVVSIGESQFPVQMTENMPSFRKLGEDYFTSVQNIVSVLDIRTADFYFSQLIPLMDEDAFEIDDKMRYRILMSAFRPAFLHEDLSQALDILTRMKALWKKSPSAINVYEYLSCYVLIYMYQNELQAASDIINACLFDPDLDEEWRFRFLLQDAMVRMSGWNNIFFLREDIAIPEELMQELLNRKYLNHYCYIELFANDNNPKKFETILENPSGHFQNVLHMIEKTGNRNLLNIAYEKNIMSSSTYGMNHITLYYYSLAMKDFGRSDEQIAGECENGSGYNLSALGHYEDAEKQYLNALHTFYHSGNLEAVSETFYNMAMNRIAMGDYYGAEDSLNGCVKVIRHLRLNRLRVCNISKLYGLLALASVLQGNLFSAEQYETRCENFISYYLARDQVDSIDSNHDYANYDDEILILKLAQALISDRKGDVEEALKNYRQTEIYLSLAGGNCYFCKPVFYPNYVDFLERTKVDQEKLIVARDSLLIYEKEMETRRGYDVNHWLPETKELSEEEKVTREEIDNLLREEESRREARTLRRNMDFLHRWQRTINVEDVNSSELLDTIMRRFQGYFSVDRCLYLQFDEKKEVNVLYNNTGVEISAYVVEEIRRAIRMNRHGLALSKMSNEYVDYRALLDCFGGDAVCSLILIPYFVGNRLEYVFMTSIQMRDSWFSMVNHYMLDEEDRSFFEVLFREVNFAIRRIENTLKIREMNRLLYQSAITDQLTGVRNRNGLYQFVDEIVEGHREDFRGRYAVMFIDLDNFKPYNDTYGHEAGDVVLVEVSQIFEKAVGNLGIVARYGGDEFILLLRTDEKAILSDLAEEIYEKIEEADGFREKIKERLGISMIEGEDAPSIGCSIGIATSVQNTDSVDVQELINDADKVLYEVKNEAKGTYRFLA